MGFATYAKAAIFDGASLDIRTSALLILLLLTCVRLNCANDAQGDEIIETVVYRDSDGIEHEEYAFREPSRGLPDHVIDMFCSSVKMRLYWAEYREQIRESARKGLYLRRMARLARHIFKDVRDADRPFNATMLSRVDIYFSAKIEADDEKIDKAIASRANGEEEQSWRAEQEEEEEEEESRAKRTSRMKSLKNMIVNKTNKLTSGRLLGHSDTKEVIEAIESGDAIRELEKAGDGAASANIKQFLKEWGPKVALGIYTRWRTMWWMMMSCLYAKYYLWDPALDEFTKLKRSLVMWPELQVTRMQDLKCKPLMFFRRLMDVCKVMNPLMNMDFGQFNLEKLTRFKSDS